MNAMCKFSESRVILSEAKDLPILFGELPFGIAAGQASPFGAQNAR